VLGIPCIGKPPLSHIGLWVDDREAAVRWLSERGMHFAPGGIRKGAGNRDVCFSHPKPNADFPVTGEGVSIELVQAPADVIAAFRSMPLVGNAT
jgi:lactoylglutathione lyase